MKKTLEIIKILFTVLFTILKNITFLLINYVCVKILYWVTHEKGEIDGILSKRKYRRIKQSIRYKLWVWYNMRFLCNFLGVDFSCYEKYYRNNKILRY